MKFSTSAILLSLAASRADAFAPSRSARMSTHVHGSVEVMVEAESAPIEVVEVEGEKEDYKGPVTAEYINGQLEKQLAKLRLKDQTSKQLEKEVSVKTKIKQKNPFFCNRQKPSLAPFMLTMGFLFVH